MTRPNASSNRVSLAQYGLACALVLTLGVLRLGLGNFLGDKSRFMLFIPAILIAAYYGGIGPGVLAIVLSTILTVWVLPIDSDPAYIAFSNESTLVLFVLVSLAILMLADRERKEKTRRQKAEYGLAALNRELEARVEERTSALEFANRELEGFCYSVAHDLRTPMRAVAGNARIVLEDCTKDLTPQIELRLRRIEQAGTKLGSLIEGLLIYARLANQELMFEQVDLGALARHTATHLAEEMKCEVNLECESDLCVMADAKMMRIAIEALIRNAVTYRKPGEPASIRVKRDGQSSYVVEDDGIGFDMAYLPKLFMPFERLHRDEEYPGIGMGLPHVERVMKRHGGRLWTKGEPGVGASFGFSLPSVSCSRD